MRSASAPRSRAYSVGTVRSPLSKLQFCCCISGPSSSRSLEAVPSKKCPKAQAQRPTKAPCRAVTPCLRKSNSGWGQSSVGSWRRDNHGQGRTSWRGPVAAGWFLALRGIWGQAPRRGRKVLGRGCDTDSRTRGARRFQARPAVFVVHTPVGHEPWHSVPRHHPRPRSSCPVACIRTP